MAIGTQFQISELTHIKSPPPFKHAQHCSFLNSLLQNNSACNMAPTQPPYQSKRGAFSPRSGGNCCVSLLSCKMKMSIQWRSFEHICSDPLHKRDRTSSSLECHKHVRTTRDANFQPPTATSLVFGFTALFLSRSVESH